MKPFPMVKALLVALAVFAGFVLATGLAIHLLGAHRLSSASKRYEREVGPLSVHAFVRERLPVERNAVTWLRPGVLATVLFTGDQALIGSLSAKPSREWAPDDVAKLEALLDRNAPAIELLSRARGMKESNWDIPYADGTTAKIPNLLAAINAAKIVNARGRLALSRGDSATAMASAETLGVLARSLEAERVSIVLLVGVTIEKQQLALAHEIIAARPTTPRQLDGLAASLCDEDLTGALRDAMRGSAAAIVHDVSGESYLEQVHNHIYRQVAKAISAFVASAAIEAHRGADQSLGGPVKEPLANPDDGGKSSWWDELVGSVAPNVASMSARITATASARELARIAIALRREALVSGRYPAALPAVEGLPAIDPLSGDPRVYTVHDDGSAELRSTTTAEILRSISPAGPLTFDALYRWTLPAPAPSR